jgi:hypothetical protein
MSTGGSTESNVRSFEAHFTILTKLSIFKKKAVKKRNNEIFTQYLTGATVV